MNIVLTSCIVFAVDLHGIAIALRTNSFKNKTRLYDNRLYLFT